MLGSCTSLVSLVSSISLVSVILCYMWLTYALLSTLGWALVNVLDSTLVHRHEKHPAALMWSQAIFSVPCLAILILTQDLQSPLWIWLIVGGATGYLGDIIFFRVLEHVDVSVSNAAWAILSLLLSIAGFLLFDESWTMLQTTGALLMIGGVFLLSFWHKHITVLRTVAMLSLLACAYLPFYVLKKWALLHGETVLAVFVWSLVGREMLSFSMPAFMPSLRRRIAAVWRNSKPRFHIINAIVIASFLAAEYFGAQAYAHGQLSLVAIVSNVQPFMVIVLAAFVLKFLPSQAARELLTGTSVRIKLIGFSIVFAGLALLSLTH